MSIIRMDFPVSQIPLTIKMIVVFKIDINCHHVHGLALLDFVVLCDVLIASEVGGFVHVQPHS